MAIKPIEDRLDELTATQKDVADIAMDQPAELLPEPISYNEEPQTFEPENTAGLGVLREVIRKAPKKTERPIVAPEKELDKVGPYQVMPEAEAAKAEEVLQTAPTMPVEGKPAETVFNLNQIKGDDGLKQFVEANARVYGADKLVKISYTDIANKAAEEGYDEAFIARLLDTSKLTNADPREAYKMLLALTDAEKRAYDLGQKVVKAKGAGELNPELATEFQQAMALAGNLAKAVKGRQADIARTLGIFSQAREATVNRGAMLDAIMAESGGVNNSFELAKRYIALDSRGARANLAEKSLGGTLKDVWFSTWINGLLSNPTTHAKNMMGNLFFGALQIPERAMASVVGKARNAMFKGGEAAIDGDEIYAQAVGMLQGIREGAEISLTAFRKNEATDPFTKIEDLRKGKNPFDMDFGDSDFGRGLSTAIDYYGKFVTLPGRALMAEDEFFKGMGYRMELNALAARNAKLEYNRLVQSGIPDDEAAKAAAEYGSRILIDPPADIDEAAKSFSRTITFTRELESGLQGMQQFLQNPLMKIFVPFVRTPTNIALEAMARVPGLNFASPRFWADYNAGGIRRDMAIGRVTLGTGIVATTAMSALEGKITGYGPMRRGDKAAMEGEGWQQFSRVFNKEDISDDLLAKFKSVTSVKEGNGKVYVSYAGLEPIGTLLGIAATAGEYSMMNADGADMDQIMLGAGLGTYQYLSEQPMLQGFADVMKTFTSGAKDAPTMFYNLLAQATKQGTEFLIGGSPLGVHSALVAGVERYMNPDKSNVMEARDEIELDILSGPRRGFWEAIRRAKSRNPLTSDSLPPELDTLTGEVKKAGKGNLYEMFSPFRTSDGKVSPGHAALVEWGVPQYFPPKKIEGVELTAEQYNRWVELATDGGKLADQVAKLASSSDMIRLFAKEGKVAVQNNIAGQVSNAYSIAKQLLIAEDADLADKIREVKEIQKDVGKYRR